MKINIILWLITVLILSNISFAGTAGKAVGRSYVSYGGAIQINTIMA